MMRSLHGIGYSNFLNPIQAHLQGEISTSLTSRISESIRCIMRFRSEIMTEGVKAGIGAVCGVLMGAFIAGTALYNVLSRRIETAGLTVVSLALGSLLATTTAVKAGIVGKEAFAVVGAGMAMGVAATNISVWARGIDSETGIAASLARAIVGAVIPVAEPLSPRIVEAYSISPDSAVIVRAMQMGIGAIALEAIVMAGKLIVRTQNEKRQRANHFPFFNALLRNHLEKLHPKEKQEFLESYKSSCMEAFETFSRSYITQLLLLREELTQTNTPDFFQKKIILLAKETTLLEAINGLKKEMEALLEEDVNQLDLIKDDVPKNPKLELIWKKGRIIAFAILNAWETNAEGQKVNSFMPKSEEIDEILQ